MFTRANPLGWALFEELTSAQMNHIDLNQSRALDGAFGGEWVPSAPVRVLGAGFGGVVEQFDNYPLILVITASGNLDPADYARFKEVELIVVGGGGGGADGPGPGAQPGGPGGGSGFRSPPGLKFRVADLTGICNITIGPGGLGAPGGKSGIASSQNGSNGSQSQFACPAAGILVRANGGFGGGQNGEGQGGNGWSGGGAPSRSNGTGGAGGFGGSDGGIVDDGTGGTGEPRAAGTGVGTTFSHAGLDGGLGGSPVASRFAGGGGAGGHWPGVTAGHGADGTGTGSGRGGEGGRGYGAGGGGGGQAAGSGGSVSGAGGQGAPGVVVLIFR